MSGDIGFDIQQEIVNRLPVKSLIRLRSVCKEWRCLIDSSYFIAAYTIRRHQRQHLFVTYWVRGKAQYVSIVDDDTFPQQRFVHTLPLSIKLLEWSTMVGTCNGLVCLVGHYYLPKNSHSTSVKPMVVVWNPSIRKSIAIHVPASALATCKSQSQVIDQTTFGFGVCPDTNDPKIVMIPQLNPLFEKSSKINDHRKVMVYTLSSGKWTSPSSNVPTKSVRVRWYGQVIDRFMYWFGSHLMAMAIYSHTQWASNMIMSFDMSNDIFEVIDLPHSLAYNPSSDVSISKLRESLVILESKKINCVVWMMENGVRKSFTKLFTITAQYGSIRGLGFRKSGKPIMEVVKDCRHDESKIAVYEPKLKHLNVLEIGGIRSISTVNSYVETLLLLGRSDCS